MAPVQRLLPVGSVRFLAPKFYELRYPPTDSRGIQLRSQCKQLIDIFESLFCHSE
jgi:hypothetical protein